MLEGDQTLQRDVKEDVNQQRGRLRRDDTGFRRACLHKEVIGLLQLSQNPVADGIWFCFVLFFNLKWGFKFLFK